MAVPIVYTAEMVRALPDDGNRYEVVDGELLVTPSPTRTHQHAVSALLLALGPYLRGQRVGEVIASPADIERDRHGLVQPDIFVEGLVEGRPTREWNAGAPLLLVVEVVSPSTARADRTTSAAGSSVPEFPNTGSWIPTRGRSSGGVRRTSGLRC